MPFSQIEKRVEMMQLGVAAACAAGLLIILSLEKTDDYTNAASFCFCVGLPLALGRAMVSFTEQIAPVHAHPLSLVLYPVTIVNGLAVSGLWIPMLPDFFRRWYCVHSRQCSRSWPRLNSRLGGPEIESERRILTQPNGPAFQIRSPSLLSLIIPLLKA